MLSGEKAKINIGNFVVYMEKAKIYVENLYSLESCVEIFDIEEFFSYI